MVGYVRVSTEEQAGSGLGLDTQRAAIQAECDRRGWTLVEMVEDAGVLRQDHDSARDDPGARTSRPRRGRRDGRREARPSVLDD